VTNIQRIPIRHGGNWAFAMGIGLATLGLADAGLPSHCVAQVTGQDNQANSISLVNATYLVNTPVSDNLPELSQDLINERALMVGQALTFLDGQQSDDGSFSNYAGTGPTSMIASAMLRHGRTQNHPAVARSIKYILSNVRPDGGIYADKSIHRNYESALAISCLAEIDNGKTYAKEIKAATGFLRTLQWDEGEQKEKDDMAYGGAGYGSHTRPDMSNTSYMIDALKAAGAKNDDPDLQKALTFITRCQNHESEFNKTEFATGGPKDGGFFYTAAAGGETKVETSEANPGGGLRSYGSMTYAGLKSMLYAGVSKEDTRVQAALTYLKKNYTLKSNPGVGAQGLYYYYHVFGKALSAMDEAQFESADGVKHDWRTELIKELSNRQQKNGSWINTQSERWMEGDASLVSAYALLAISYAK